MLKVDDWYILQKNFYVNWKSWLLPEVVLVDIFSAINTEIASDTYRKVELQIWSELYLISMYTFLKIRTWLIGRSEEIVTILSCSHSVNLG